MDQFRETADHRELGGGDHMHAVCVLVDQRSGDAIFCLGGDLEHFVLCRICECFGSILSCMLIDSEDCAGHPVSLVWKGFAA
jgi:hypothetical protein